MGSGAAMIFLGSASSGRLVEKVPSVTVPIAGAGKTGDSGEETDFQISFGREGGRIQAVSARTGGPRPVDLDGVHRSEILVARRDDRGRGLLQVILLAPR